MSVFRSGVPELADPFDHVEALADLADQRVFGRQASPCGAGDDVELAARGARAARPSSSPSPRCLWCSRGWRRRLLDHFVAGAAAAGAERIAALDHEFGDDPVEGEVVVEAFFGEVGEGVGGLRRLAWCRARSRRCRSWSRPPRSASSPFLTRLLRAPCRLTCFGFGRFDLLAAASALGSRSVARVRCRCRRCARSGSTATIADGEHREDGEDDPAPDRSAPLHRRGRLEQLRRVEPSDSIASAAAAADPPGRRRPPRRPRPSGSWRSSAATATAALFLAREFPARPGARDRRRRRAGPRGDRAGSASTPRAGSPSRSAGRARSPSRTTTSTSSPALDAPPGAGRDRPGCCAPAAT